MSNINEINNILYYMVLPIMLIRALGSTFFTVEIMTEIAIKLVGMVGGTLRKFLVEIVGML